MKRICDSSDRVQIELTTKELVDTIINLDKKFPIYKKFKDIYDAMIEKKYKKLREELEEDRE